eukprot:613430_1
MQIRNFMSVCYSDVMCKQQYRVLHGILVITALSIFVLYFFNTNQQKYLYFMDGIEESIETTHITLEHIMIQNNTDIDRNTTMQSNISQIKRTIEPNTTATNIEPRYHIHHSALHHNHICLDGNQVYTPLPTDYFTKWLNYSLWYHQNLTEQLNTTIPQTLITNTIKHFDINSSTSYLTYVPINISFTAYDINDNIKQHGGDEFKVFAQYIDANITLAKQAFYVQDIFNGTYIIHMLFSIAATYNISIMHKYCCADSMINKYSYGINMTWHYLTTITVLDYNEYTEPFVLPTCPYNQHGLDMISSGMWTDPSGIWRDNTGKWQPYCCTYRIEDTRYLAKNAIVYVVGDSTLTGRQYEVGNPYGHGNERWIQLQQDLKNNSLQMDSYNKSIVLVTNINLHPVLRYEDLNEACGLSMRYICEFIYYAGINYHQNELNVVVVGGTGIHEQLWPVKDLVTDYRARYHDECVKKNIKIMNQMIRDARLGMSMQNASVCSNKTISDVVFNRLKKDIFFVDISNMRIARWEINQQLRPHDKIHGFLTTTRMFYVYAMYMRAKWSDETDEVMK